MTGARLTDLARPPLFIPVLTSLVEFTATLQRAGVHVAVVIDEHGSTLGLGFLEDAIEEVMGPIVDEFDEPHLQVEKRHDPASSLWLRLSAGVGP